MKQSDRRPVPNTPVSATLERHANNRFGAVLSSLHSFWVARDASLHASGLGARRDSYSVLLFDSAVTEALYNDLTSSPVQLINTVLQYSPTGYTDFNNAIVNTRDVMQRAWSTER